MPIVFLSPLFNTRIEVVTPLLVEVRICKYTDSHTYLLKFEINKIISIIPSIINDTRCSVTNSI